MVILQWTQSVGTQVREFDMAKKREFFREQNLAVDSDCHEFVIIVST